MITVLSSRRADPASVIPETKMKTTKRPFAVKLIMCLLAALLAASLLSGCEDPEKAAKEAAEKAKSEEEQRIEELMQHNAELLAEYQRTLTEKQAQENEAWKNTLKEFENAPERIKKEVSALPLIGLGDSVMLGSQKKLEEHFPNAYIYAVKGYTCYAAPAKIKELAKNNKLGDPVILNYGANGDAPERVKKNIMELLGERKVYWITNTNSHMLHINNRIKNLAKSYSNLKVLDWEELSRKHREYFFKDEIHLTEDGCRAFADMVFNTIYQEYLDEWIPQRDAQIESHDTALVQKLVIFGDEMLVNAFPQIKEMFPGDMIIGGTY